MFWNDTIFVILALKNRGDTNKPDRKTIIVQITTASVVVKGDLNDKNIQFFSYAIYCLCPFYFIILHFPKNEK